MQGKNKITVIKNRYIKVPNDIFKMGLAPGAISLYILLLSYPESFNPSIKKIARDLGISKNSARKFRNELTEKNLIGCLKRGNHQIRSEYEFRLQKYWNWPK